MDRKTLPLQTVLFLFLFLSWILPSISSQSPTPSPSDVSTNTNNHNLRRILLGVLFGSLTCFSVAPLFVFSVRLCLLYTNRTPILKGPVVFSPKTLQLALSQEAQPLGSSPNGKYYRLVLANDLTVAVKRLEPECSNASPAPQSTSAKRRVQQELEMLVRMKHRNVMSLPAYVWDHDRFSLVYDYVPSGSLEDAMKKLRSNQIRIGWEVRHRLLLG